IADLGLCRPENQNLLQNNKKQVYGVLPYVAPEVLKGEDYTKASDIYGFGIVSYEVMTGLPPYNDVVHEEYLAIRICPGLRPMNNYKVPQLMLDIVQQCWDANPSKRPKASELFDLFHNLYNSYEDN
ncbi:1715_t:CDS:1, partial [Funneliformis geosporum]